MASFSTVRLALRSAFVVSLLLLVFHVGQPLYWKISSTVRENRQSVKEGISKIVFDAQRSVGWFSDESDSGFAADGAGRKLSAAAGRRIL